MTSGNPARLLSNMSAHQIKDRMDRVLVVAGLVSLLHSAYSAAQHRTFVRLTSEDVALPLDVIIQALISLLVTMYGVVCISGDLREIRATEELKSKTWETLDNRPNFYCFNHRGQSLFGLCPPPMPLTKSALEGPS